MLDPDGGIASTLRKYRRAAPSHPRAESDCCASWELRRRHACHGCGKAGSRGRSTVTRGVAGVAWEDFWRGCRGSVGVVGVCVVRVWLWCGVVCGCLGGCWSLPGLCWPMAHIGKKHGLSWPVCSRLGQSQRAPRLCGLKLLISKPALCCSLPSAPYYPDSRHQTTTPSLPMVQRHAATSHRQLRTVLATATSNLA